MPFCSDKSPFWTQNGLSRCKIDARWANCERFVKETCLFTSLISLPTLGRLVANKIDDILMSILEVLVPANLVAFRGNICARYINSWKYMRNAILEYSLPKPQLSASKIKSQWPLSNWMVELQNAKLAIFLWTKPFNKFIKTDLSIKTTELVSHRAPLRAEKVFDGSDWLGPFKQNWEFDWSSQLNSNRLSFSMGFLSSWYHGSGNQLKDSHMPCRLQRKNTCDVLLQVESRRLQWVYYYFSLQVARLVAVKGDAKDSLSGKVRMAYVTLPWFNWYIISYP